MVTINQIAEIGDLVRDPGRAAILLSLMDGRALTAGELARVAGITPQTASSHLRRLSDANLIEAWKQGRHHYHRLARPELAHMLEGIMRIAESDAGPTRRVATGPRDLALRRARTCYDHMAGRLAVAIADAMDAEGLVARDGASGAVTARGLAFLKRWKISLDAGSGRPRRGLKPACRPCMDWSERRFHFAGRLGTALHAHFLARDYVRRSPGSRALEITRAGNEALRAMFEIRDLA